MTPNYLPSTSASGGCSTDSDLNDYLNNTPDPPRDEIEEFLFDHDQISSYEEIDTTFRENYAMLEKFLKFLKDAGRLKK